MDLARGRDDGGGPVGGGDVLVRVDDGREQVVARESLGGAGQVGAEPPRLAMTAKTILALKDDFAALDLARVPVELVEPFLPGREVGARQARQLGGFLRIAVHIPARPRVSLLARRAFRVEPIT